MLRGEGDVSHIQIFARTCKSDTSLFFFFLHISSTNEKIEIVRPLLVKLGHL